MNPIQEWTPSTLLSLGAQDMSGPINTIVTNVPGPQLPLYLHGARVRKIYPAVPLMQGMGLGIALTSHAGTIGIGFKCDQDIFSDVDLFVSRFQQSFKRAAEVAKVDVGPTSYNVYQIYDAVKARETP